MIIMRSNVANKGKDGKLAYKALSLEAEMRRSRTAR